MRLTCGVLGHSRQANYAWLVNPVSEREVEDAYLMGALIDAHGDDPEFGYRFLADELERTGHVVGERRVWRLCSQQQLWSTTVRKGRRGSGKTPGPAGHDDLVQRDFTAPAPDTVWVTDITEHATAEGEPSCCAIRPRVPVPSEIVPGSPDRRRARRAGSPRPATTPRSSPGTRCCRGTSSIAAAGAPATSSTKRSCSGSSAPTPAAVGNAPSATPLEFELAFTRQAAVAA